MAKTRVPTNSALAKKLQDEQLFRDVLAASYFRRFFGKDKGALVYEKTDLEKQKGDAITFGLRGLLTGEGVTSGQTLEGNEEDLKLYDFTVTLERYRHAVRDEGDLSRQRTAFDLIAEHRAAIKEWGSGKIDTLCFEAIAADPTVVFYPTATASAWTDDAAAAKTALTANTKLTPELIERAAAFAKDGGDRYMVPLRPIKVDGNEHLVLLVPGPVAYDLRRDEEWLQNMRDALPRDSKHPIFTGALGMQGNVVIHSHEKVLKARDGGSGGTIPYGKCSLMGAQALCWAWGTRPKTIEAKFDYEEEIGVAWAMTAAVGKSHFDSKDYGSIAVYVSHTDIATKAA